MDLGKELNLPIRAKTIDLASCAEYVSWKLFENCSTVQVRQCSTSHAHYFFLVLMASHITCNV